MYIYVKIEKKERENNFAFYLQINIQSKKQPTSSFLTLL
jgi:hypothetical protein